MRLLAYVAVSLVTLWLVEVIVFAVSYRRAVRRGLR